MATRLSDLAAHFNPDRDVMVRAMEHVSIHDLSAWCGAVWEDRQVGGWVLASTVTREPVVRCTAARGSYRDLGVWLEWALRQLDRYHAERGIETTSLESDPLPSLAGEREMILGVDRV